MGPGDENENNEELHERLTIPEAGDLLDKLTQQEKMFCEYLVFHNLEHFPKRALKLAGSQAQDHNLSRMAYEMKQKPHVAAYINELKEVVNTQAKIHIQEVINNARRAIEMAFANNKPKDADGPNRLLAEMGGHIKTHAPSPVPKTQNLQINNYLKSKKSDGVKKPGMLASEVDRLQSIMNKSNKIIDVVNEDEDEE